MNQNEYAVMLRSAGVSEDKIVTLVQAFTTGELSGYNKAIKALYSKQADSYESDHCNTYFGLRPTNLGWSAWLIKHKDDFIA